MGRITWMAGAVIGAVGLAVGSVAVASPPVKTPIPFLATFPGYAGACEFPITVAFDTQQTMRQWQNANGEMVRMHVTGKGSVTLTNDGDDASIRVNASGPTHGKNGPSKGTGHWVLIGTQAQAQYLPFPPGAWLYSGRIGNLDAADYSTVFKGTITDLCAAIS